jgi:hypothetical protein
MTKIPFPIVNLTHNLKLYEPPHIGCCQQPCFLVWYLMLAGINIMLRCGKEYVKLAWEFICKPGWENLDLLQVKKSEMTKKTKILYVLSSSVSWKDIAEK